MTKCRGCTNNCRLTINQFQRRSQVHHRQSLRAGTWQGEGTEQAEIEEKYGLKTTAIVTMAEVVEHLYNKPYKGKIIIDDTLKAAIDTYYKQYRRE